VGEGIKRERVEEELVSWWLSLGGVAE